MSDFAVYSITALIVIGFVIKEAAAYRMPASHWLNAGFRGLGDFVDELEPHASDCNTDAGSGCDGDD